MGTWRSTQPTSWALDGARLASASQVICAARIDESSRFFARLWGCSPPGGGGSGVGLGTPWRGRVPFDRRVSHLAAGRSPAGTLPVKRQHGVLAVDQHPANRAGQCLARR